MFLAPAHERLQQSRTSRSRYWSKRAEGKGHSVGSSNLGFDLRNGIRRPSWCQCSTFTPVTEMARNLIHDATLQPTITLSVSPADDFVTGVFIHHGATDLHHRRVGLNITCKDVCSGDAGSSSRTRRCGWPVAALIQAIHGWALRFHPQVASCSSNPSACEGNMPTGGPAVMVAGSLPLLHPRITSERGTVESGTRRTPTALFRLLEKPHLMDGRRNRKFVLIIALAWPWVVLLVGWHAGLLVG